MSDEPVLKAAVRALQAKYGVMEPKNREQRRYYEAQLRYYKMRSLVNIEPGKKRN